MPLNRIACPECGAGLKSASGFDPGDTVSCPKCETDFVVPEPEPDEVPKKGKAAGKKPVRAAASDEDERPKKKKKKKAGDEDEDEWSYKNSWIRYAILGVLLVVLAVLGYMLYKKRQADAQAAAFPAAGERPA